MEGVSIVDPRPSLSMNFDERQQLLRLVVDQIIIDQDVVRVETIIPLDHELGQLRTDLVETGRVERDLKCGSLGDPLTIRVLIAA